jgi:hypothetical protein
MFFAKADKKTGGAQTPGRAGKPVHSIAALLKQKSFEGSFEARGSHYEFTYLPARAEIAEGKLHLQGALSIKDARGRTRLLDRVRAVLVSTQGGLGAAPIRRQILSGGAQTGNVATGQQQQQVAGEPARNPGEPAQASRGGLPVVDSTGPLSFCGVLYFRFEPIDGRALGVGADLSRVQLNARLAPTDDKARELHGLYSLLVEALYGQTVDEKLGAAAVAEINKALGAG